MRMTRAPQHQPRGDTFNARRILHSCLGRTRAARRQPKPTAQHAAGPFFSCLQSILPTVPTRTQLLKFLIPEQVADELNKALRSTIAPHLPNGPCCLQPIAGRMRRDVNYH